jgi:hypothetical protein
MRPIAAATAASTAVNTGALCLRLLGEPAAVVALLLLLLLALFHATITPHKSPLSVATGTSKALLLCTIHAHVCKQTTFVNEYTQYVCH